MLLILIHVFSFPFAYVRTYICTKVKLIFNMKHEKVIKYIVIYAYVHTHKQVHNHIVHKKKSEARYAFQCFVLSNNFCDISISYIIMDI